MYFNVFFLIYAQAMSLMMLKKLYRASKCYFKLSSKAFSHCGQNVCPVIQLESDVVFYLLNLI